MNVILFLVIVALIAIIMPLIPLWIAKSALTAVGILFIIGIIAWAIK